MKVVILAGGFGTRISEESHLRPKPMIEIGEKPILWHIMKIYSHHGFNDFVICLGYKGYFIKEYFAHYFLHESSVTFDFREGGQLITHDDNVVEPWRVTLVNTGGDTATGGRVRRVRPYVGEEPFMLTYGDGVADIDIRRLVKFHRSHGRIATVTSTQPAGRFGVLDIGKRGVVRRYLEKPRGDGTWINAGFFVLQPEVFDYIAGDDTILEMEPLQRLSRDRQLMTYRHRGFWQSMDTLRDRNLLERHWATGEAPWKTWS